MSQRIFVVGRHRLVCQAAQSLLGEMDAEWIGFQQKLENGLENLKTQPADILLVESDTPIPTLCAVLEQANGNTPNKVVVFSISENRVHLYHYERRPIQQGADLIEALRTIAEQRDKAV